MQIQWTGLGSFRIQTQQAVIVTDPFADNYGMTMPKLKADIVVVSDPKNTLTNNTKRLSGDFMVIDGPGEYEIKQAFIYGIAASHTMYLIEDEGMTVAFLGPLDSGLTDDQLEKLEGADILLLPVGTLNKEQRTVIVSQVEPRVIIPYLYKQPNVKLELDTLDIFLKELGAKPSAAQEKYVVKPKDLPQGETDVIILSSSQA